MREAIFDVLWSMTSFEDARVADLFCGSGAMGIEALSRGASSAVFVDDDPAAIRSVKSNLAATGLEKSAVTLVRSDVLDWLARSRRSSSGLGRSPTESHGPFDLALCDPPYAFDKWGQLLADLQAEIAVLETNGAVEVPDNWKIVKNKRYGGTLVTVVRAAGTERVQDSYRGDGVREIPAFGSRTDSTKKRDLP